MTNGLLEELMSDSRLSRELDGGELPKELGGGGLSGEVSDACSLDASGCKR